ncbi:MAG: 30S ribosomal protein S16 [Candidatus Levybacteria bacterium]|nr:30S ribosomal protein S16 [Candidatus Levybacteria bacterium]
MAVVIRLTRTGKKGERKFRIVVKEKRSRRDGDSVEVLGWYEKTPDNSRKKINLDRYKYWISQGALPSKTVSEIVK